MIKHIKFLTPIILIITLFSCKNEESNNFDFSYLENSNQVLSDTTMLKLQLYFNKRLFGETEFYLKNIDKFKDIRSNLDVFAALDYAALGYDIYLDGRLKRLLVENEKGYKNWVLDTLFYSKFPLEQLEFLAESYYWDLYNVNYERELYNDITSILHFKYNYNTPFWIRGNELHLNVMFNNVSEYEIESFKGDIYITDNNNNKLLTLDVDSKIKGNTIMLPDPMSTELEYRENRFLIKYKNSGLNDDGTYYPIDDYTKNKLLSHFADKPINIRMVFIPSEIKLMNGKTFYK